MKSKYTVIVIVFFLLHGLHVGAQREVGHLHLGVNAGVPFTNTAYYYEVKTAATVERSVRLSNVVWLNFGAAIGRTWPTLDPKIFLRQASVSTELLLYHPEKHRFGLRCGVANNLYWARLPAVEVLNGWFFPTKPFTERYWMYSGLLGVIARVGKCTDVSLMCNIETSYTKVDVRSNNLILLCVRRPLWTVTRSAPDANGKRARAVIPFWKRIKKGETASS